MLKRMALILGASRAGMAATREFGWRTAITPIALESSDSMGGISCKEAKVAGSGRAGAGWIEPEPPLREGINQWLKRLKPEVTV